jgi:hypothetical protein
MGIVSRAADTYYAYRFVKILSTPWDEMDAYDLGIIDENGKVLRKARTLRTSEEKSAYTIFHRLVFGIKRILEKLPGGRTVAASYAAALFLIKEHTGMTDEQLGAVFDKIGIDLEDMELNESLEEQPWFIQGSSRQIAPGTYELRTEALSPSTGEIIGHPHQRVIVDENTVPIGSVRNTNVYRVRHADTHHDVYVTARDIQR